VAKAAFYHMTMSSAESVLPKLMEKTLQKGKRALICCKKEQMKLLSAALWSSRQNSWLPHGSAGQDDDDAALCPIWLAGGIDDNPNQASFFFFLNSVRPDGLEQAERVFILFDGRDDEAVGAARGQWKTLKGAGHELSYWTEDNTGKWSETALN
jgi:DNA polymerase-3 subunit chi